MPAPQKKWWYMWDIYMVQLSILEAQCSFLGPSQTNKESSWCDCLKRLQRLQITSFGLVRCSASSQSKFSTLNIKSQSSCDISMNWPLIMCIMKTTFLYCTMHLMRVLSDCTKQSLKNRCCWISLHFFWLNPRLVSQDDTGESPKRFHPPSAGFTSPPAVYRL